MRTMPDLRWPLTLESPVETADGAGGVTVQWIPLGAIPAAIEAVSGSERSGLGREVAAVTYRVTIRAAAHGAPNRPRPDQRFTAGSRVLAIRAVFDRTGLGRYLTCLCEENPS